MAKRAPKAQPDNRWRSRIIGEGDEAPDQLLAHPENFRVHATTQGDALAGAIGTIGWIQRVVVNRRSGHVVDGHLRVKLAMQRGEPTVPVLYVDLDENEERIALATLDPIAAMAGTDNDLLRELLGSIEAEDPQLRAFLEELKPDEAEAAKGGRTADEARTVPGELVQLGAHRLLCGNPSDDHDRQAVMGRTPSGTVLDLVHAAVAPMLDKPTPLPIRLIEPDPHTCDRIVDAWEAATGRAAKRIPPG